MFSLGRALFGTRFCEKSDGWVHTHTPGRKNQKRLVIVLAGILNQNEFVEIFELAGPGKEFGVYSENHFRRRK